MFSRRHIAVLSIASFLCAQMPVMPAFAGQMTADSLIGYWKLDETSGTTAADSSGAGKTGTHQNTPTISTDVPSVSFTDTRSLSFTGTSSQYVTANAVRTNGNAAFTYSLWFKTTDSTNAYRTMLSEGRSTLDASTFHIQMPGDADGICTVDDSLKVYMSDDSSTVATLCSSATYNDGQWHHVALIQSNSSSRQLFVDGVSVATDTTTLSTTTFDEVGIGALRNSTVSQYFTGKIDDVRIYNRSLAPWEIAQLAAGNHIQAFWKGGNGTGLENRSNWSGSYVPDPYSRLVIRATASDPLMLTGAIKAAGLTINTGALMSLNGTGLTVNDAGTFTNYGTLALRNTETLTNFTNDTSKGTIMIIGSGSTTGLKTGNTYNHLTLNDGLVGYWKLNETSGTRAADSSGYGNSGSLIGSPTVSTAVPGVNFYDGRSLTFDGVDDAVYVGDAALLQPPNEVTMSAWFKTTNAGYQRLIRKRWYGYSLNMNGGQIVTDIWEANGTSLTVTSPSTYNDGAWHHAVSTYDGTNVLLYVDGMQVGKTVGSGTHAIFYSAGGLAIGRDGDNPGDFFSGNIDDVRIYNRALKTGEVSALAAGNEPSVSKGTVTLNAGLSLNGTLKLNGGTLDVSSSNYGISIGGSLLNNGSIINARKGTITFNGTIVGMEVLTGGQRFNNVTFDGAGGTWNMRDRLTASGALTLSAGTLDASGSYALRTGTFTQTSGTFIPRSGTVVLTSSNDSTSIFTGTLNTLRIEDSTEEGLVGYWKFDEGTNTGAILDSSGYGNTGARSGSGFVWTGATLASAISFNNPFALHFNGINDMVVMPQSSRYELQAFTYSAWIYLSPSAGDRNTIMTYGQGTELGGAIATESVGFIYHQTSNILRLRLTDSLENLFIDIQKTPATSLSGRWSHVAATWDGTTATLYQDGASLGSTSSAGTINYTNDPLSKLRIGNWFGNNERYFRGSMDDVRIYDRALSSREITNLARGRYAKGGSQTAIHSLGADLTTASLAIDSGDFETSHDLTVTNTLSMLRGRGDLILGGGLTTLGGLTMSGAVFHATSGSMDINGNVIISTGSISLPIGTTYVSGNWQRTGGTFDANGGTVVLDGENQTLTGSTTFYSLTKTVTTPHTLSFAPDNTFTVEGTLTLNGAAFNLLSLRSTTAGRSWIINPSGTKTIAHLDVMDSNNANATAIDCIGLHCDDSGNNTNWLFDPVSSSTPQSGGGFRGHQTGLDTALRARATIVESYRRSIVRGGHGSGSHVLTLSTPATQPTESLPSKIGTYAIALQRNRLVLETDGVRLMYKDVVADSWYAPYVADVIKNNIARGYQGSDGKLTGEFGVANFITRAEVLKMTLEAAKKTDVKAAPPRNTSAQNTWASTYVGIAEALNLSVFAPTVDVNKSATRGEVIQTILEALNITIGNTNATFVDVPATHPYSHAIAAAAFFGLIEGDTDANGKPLNTFRPDQPINRAEVAKLIALAKEIMK